MSDHIVNLDKLAAEKSQEIVKEIVRRSETIADVNKSIETLERLVTKTLGVLQEQGVYAMMLFLYSRTSSEKKVAEKSILPVFISILRSIAVVDNAQSLPESNSNREEVLKFYAEITSNLDILLLIRNLYEQILIYTRYHAKARAGQDGVESL